MTVVFSTYQSIDVISKSQQKLMENGFPEITDSGEDMASGELIKKSINLVVVNVVFILLTL